MSIGSGLALPQSSYIEGPQDAACLLDPAHNGTAGDPPDWIVELLTRAR